MNTTEEIVRQYQDELRELALEGVEGTDAARAAADGVSRRLGLAWDDILTELAGAGIVVP